MFLTSIGAMLLPRSMEAIWGNAKTSSRLSPSLCFFRPLLASGAVRGGDGRDVMLAKSSQRSRAPGVSGGVLRLCGCLGVVMSMMSSEPSTLGPVSASLGGPFTPTPSASSSNAFTSSTSASVLELCRRRGLEVPGALSRLCVPFSRIWSPDGVTFSLCLRFFRAGSVFFSRTGELLRFEEALGFADRLADEAEEPKKAERGSCPPPTESGISKREHPHKGQRAVANGVRRRRVHWGHRPGGK